MDRFVAGDRAPSSPERAKMLACAYPALDRPMILFQNVVEILHRRADLARRATPRRPGTTRKNADTNQPPEAVTSGSNCLRLNRPETDDARSIGPAYQTTPAKLQHFPLSDFGPFLSRRISSLNPIHLTPGAFGFQRSIFQSSALGSAFTYRIMV